jgi:hypothetical protein
MLPGRNVYWGAAAAARLMSFFPLRMPVQHH